MTDSAAPAPLPPDDAPVPTPQQEAEQEEQAKRSLLWPLAALVLVGLVGFLVVRGMADNPTGPDASTPQTEAAAPPDTAALASLDAFMVADLRPLVGRAVRLRDVSPAKVIGDSSFLVRGAQGQALLAVLDDLGEAQPGSPDGRYTVRQGQALDLTGTVVAYPPPDTVVLSAEDRAAARRQGIYLRVRRVASAP